MISSQSKGLNTAQAAIYGLLSLPTLLILVRHGKRGIIGWFYLFMFETLRIAGCAIILSAPQSSGGSIISSIGLSPLLLATLGILHEASCYCTPNVPRNLKIVLVAFLHFIIASGLGLVAAGSSALTSPSTTTDGPTLVKAGMVILLLSWVALFGATCAALRMSRNNHTQRLRVQVDDGSLLLKTVLIALVLIAIRVIYAVVSAFVRSPTVNPITGNLAIRVCLSVLPELLVAILFVVVGLKTIAITKEEKASASEAMTTAKV